MHICQFANQQNSGSFWEQPSIAFPSASEILHEGQLFSYKNDGFMPETYILTKSHLIKRDGLISMKAGNVRWVSILPFAEFGKKLLRLGFTIKHADEKIDFYVANENALDEWLKHLEKLSILQDIKKDYKVGEIIGSGGQSVVRLGISLETGEKVAIKSYDKQVLRDKSKCYKALVNEISILRELSHSNIVKLYRVYESTLYIHLVMEYAAGVELYQCLKANGKYTQEDASKFMWKLLDTLQYLEESKVVHQDLKPENIMLTDLADKSQFKLIDFGLAMKYDGIGTLDTCGSPGYIAPEILMNRKHGPKVDTYSAGIIFYILLSGYSPFSSPTRAEVLKKNCDNDISFGSDWLKIDSKLVRIIRMMTNFNPDLRISTGDVKAYLQMNQSSFPCCSRRASTLDVSVKEFELVGKSKMKEKEMGRDAKAALEAAREYRNALANKTRRGSIKPAF